MRECVSRQKKETRLFRSMLERGRVRVSHQGGEGEGTRGKWRQGEGWREESEGRMKKGCEVMRPRRGKITN